MFFQWEMNGETVEMVPDSYGAPKKDKGWS